MRCDIMRLFEMVDGAIEKFIEKRFKGSHLAQRPFLGWWGERKDYA